MHLNLSPTSRRSARRLRGRARPPVDVALVAEGTYPYVLGGVATVMHQIIAANPDLQFGIIHIAWAPGPPAAWAYPRLPQVCWVHPIYLAPTASRELAWSPRHPAYRHLESQRDALAPFGSVAAWLACASGAAARRLLDQSYPKARVYHAHTTGFAGLAAVAACWQRSGRFLLSEHALYARDAGRLASPPRDPEPDDGHKPCQGLANEMLPLPVTREHPETWQAWVNGLSRLIHQQCERAAYLYPAIRDEALGYGLRPEKALVIPNGVDYERFAAARRSQETRRGHRRRCRAGLAPWHLGFIGRIVPIKGLIELIDAVGQLCQRGLHVAVVLIGPRDEDPAYARRCAETIAQAGLQNIVRLVGRQDAALSLAQLDLLLLPSHSEAQPLVLLEAMAASVPLVASDVGDVAGLVGRAAPLLPDETLMPAGVLVAPGDAAQLAQAIDDLLQDEDRYERCRRAGPRRVARYFREETVGAAYRRLYQSDPQ